MAYIERDYISPNFIEHEITYAGKYGGKGEKTKKRLPWRSKRIITGTR